MVGATASGVTVCCPECGAALRVAFADGGSILSCHLCGEAVRVPARPHPVETPADAPPPLPPALAHRAARGVRLLQVSLALFAVEHLLLAAVLVLWVRAVGPAGVAARDLGDLGPWLALALGVDLGLVTVRTVARAVGYRRCEAAAAAVGAAGWVRWGWWAPGLRLVGYLATFGPWAWGLRFADAPAGVQAASTVGSVAWATGAVLEFGVLAAWGRLLAVLGDRYASGRAVRYAVGVVGGLVVMTVGLMLVQLAAIQALRRADPSARPRLSWAELPADALPALAGLAVVAAGLTAALWLHYARLLAALRDRLRAG